MSGVYTSNTPSLWVFLYLWKISSTSSSTFLPYASQDYSTILIPPNGIIALFKGLSVCRPTISSKSLSIYPASCADTVEIVFVSISNTPPSLSCSFLYNSKTSFHNLSVFSVVFSKKFESPS